MNGVRIFLIIYLKAEVWNTLEPILFLQATMKFIKKQRCSRPALLSALSRRKIREAVLWKGFLSVMEKRLKGQRIASAVNFPHTAYRQDRCFQQA
jgi:hypothetical protein